MPTTTIDDLKRRSLSTLGYTGSVDDMYRKYLQSISGSSLSSINDLEKLVLGGSGNYADRWRIHLNLHGITQKSLDDSLYTYWNSVGASGLTVPYLFRNSEIGVWYDPSDFSTLFQDSAGTTPVTAVGQPVGRILDKSGNGYHATQATSTARPTIQVDANGKYYLKFDGVDDFMQSAAINFAGTDKITVFVGWTHNVAQVSSLCELSAAPTTTAGCFRLGGNASSQVFQGIRGTSDLLVTGDTRTLPFARITTASYDIAGTTLETELSMRSNGVAKTLTLSSGTTAGTGNFSSNPIFIGMRGGLTNPLNGHLYSLIVRGVTSSSSQITATETYINSRTGAY